MKRRTTNIFALLLALVAIGIVLPTGVVAQEEEDKGDVRVTKPPKLVEASEAEYTEEAIEARVEGVVKLRLTIDAGGEVVEVEVLDGLGYGLDESAVEAAKDFVFEPAEINNQPAAVTLTFQIDFSLPILPSVFAGKVVDAATGNGVEASVTITYKEGELEFEEPPTATTRTDPDGSFVFEDVPPGTYDVQLDIDRYQGFSTTVDLVPGKTSEVDYKVQAKQENLVGRVREAGTRTPLAGIEVQLLSQESGEKLRETFTDAEGRFGFRGVDPGRVTVRLAGEGYLTSASGVEVAAGEITEATFFIEKEVYDEYRVETTERRARTQVNRRQISLEEVRRIPGTGGDVVRVVQNLPGVARAPFVSGAIVVRGSAPQDTQTFLDGDNIPLVYHFFGGPAVINSEMIDSLEFYPGNFSVYYGRATGGIIDLSTRSPKKDRIHGNIEIDLLDATALVEGPITEDLSIAISARRSYFDVFLPLVIPDDGPDIFVAPRYYDYQTWLTWTGFENHKLELLIYGSDDRIEVLLPEDEPQGNAEVQVTGLDLNNSFYRGQFKWQWRPTYPIENDFMVSFGRNIISFEAAENFRFDTGVWFSQLRNDTRWKLADSLTLRFGADFIYGLADFEIRTPRFEDDSDRDGDGDGGGRPNFSRDGLAFEGQDPVLQPAFYTELQARPLDDWLIVPGIRVDHFGQTNSTSVQPRLSTRYDITDRVTAKGGVGLFTQPTVAGSTNEFFGNPDLTFEKAMQYAVGGEWKPLDYLEFDVTLFYRDLWDILSNTNQFEVDPVTGETDPVTFLNEGEGRAYGAEVLLRHYPQNRFFGWLAYTLSRSERRNLETGEYFPFEFDQTHILTLVAGYNLPYGIDVSARFRLVTGAPFTPVVGSAYDVEQDGYEQVFGETNSARNATFNQLDLRIDKKFVFQSWILGLYIDVQNVYYAENQEGVRYNYDYTEQEPVMGLPILPTVGISAQF